MEKNRFNFGNSTRDSWGAISDREEELKRQLEELHREREDLKRYEESQDAAALENWDNIKKTIPGLNVVELYANQIKQLKEELKNIPVMHSSRQDSLQLQQYNQRRDEINKFIAAKEKILSRKLAQIVNKFGGRGELAVDYINQEIDGNLLPSVAASLRDIRDLQNSGDKISRDSLDTGLPSEKLDELADKASEESIDNKAELDDQSKLDEISDEFDKAVLDGASTDQLREIAERYYKELSKYRTKGETGDPDLYKRNAPRYKLMNDYISAIEKPEPGEPNEIDEDKDPSKLEKAKEHWGKLGKKIGRFLDEHPKTRKAVKVFLGISAVGAVSVGSFMIGRSTASANGQNSSNNNEPRTEHFTNNNQSNQNKSKYDSAINDVLENNKDTEKNLEGYNAGKDIYETEKPQKEYLEDFASSREGLSTEDYRKFLMNEASTNPIMMLTKLDHAGLIPEFLDQDGDGDITDAQLHEIADKMAEDPALFKKVQDYYKKAVENAIIGEENEITNTFDSEYITKDANGKQRLAHSKDLNIGGKMRSIQFRIKNADGSFKNGKSYNESTKCTQGVTIKSSYNFNSWVPRGDEIKITPNTPTPDKPNNPGEETPPPTPDKPNNPGEETPPPTPDTPKDLEKKDWSKQKAGDEVTPMDKGEFREDNSTRSSELDYTYKAAPQIGQETPNLGVDYGNTYNGQKAENQYNPSLEQQDAGVAGKSAEIDRQNQEAAARQAETDKAAENIQNPNRVTLADGTVIDLPPAN